MTVPLFVIPSIFGETFFLATKYYLIAKSLQKKLLHCLVFKYILTVTWEKPIHNNNTVSAWEGTTIFLTEKVKNVYGKDQCNGVDRTGTNIVFNI